MKYNNLTRYIYIYIYIYIDIYIAIDYWLLHAIAAFLEDGHDPHLGSMLHTISCGFGVPRNYMLLESIERGTHVFLGARKWWKGCAMEPVTRVKLGVVERVRFWFLDSNGWLVVSGLWKGLSLGDQHTPSLTLMQTSRCLTSTKKFWPQHRHQRGTNSPNFHKTHHWEVFYELSRQRMLDKKRCQPGQKTTTPPTGWYLVKFHRDRKHEFLAPERLYSFLEGKWHPLFHGNLCRLVKYYRLGIWYGIVVTTQLYWDYLRSHEVRILEWTNQHFYATYSDLFPPRLVTPKGNEK